MSLTDFLPKYAFVDPNLPENLEAYARDFYEVVNDKKEFFDLTLKRSEEPLSFKGDLYKHQKIISRFLSSYTPYNSLLVFHYMGTGKTCSAFGTTEKIRAEDELRISQGEKPAFKGVLVLARGQGLLRNLISELVFKCTDGRYIPENYETLTEGEKVQRIKKKVGPYYRFYTFYNLAKELYPLSDKNIKDRFSNHVVIIDEVHNIRKAEEKDENVQDTYDQLHRLLHTADGSKTLLLSGTPMRDEANEIAMVMNLILPEDDQLPVGDAFDKKFMANNSFNGSEQEYLLLKPGKTGTLKRYFKGRVSFLTNFVSIGRQYVGEYHINNISTFTLDADFMSLFQSKYYREAWNRDAKQKAIRIHSRQASLMVFPDGSYGNEGYKTISKKIARKTIKEGEQVNVEKVVHDLSAIRTFLNQGGGDAPNKLKNLARLSSKYARAISQILEAEKRSCFVYCNLVEGSGAIVFSLLLKEFGFSEARGAESSKEPRYGILTHKTTSAAQMGRIINRFNQPDNFQGEYIKVVIGSRVIGEGVSLLNVQDIHVLTPWWNYAEISQAVARGIREGSHRDLVRNGIQPQIRIYQHASVPRAKIKDKDVVRDQYDKSIDVEMYSISAAKDISIKSVERVLKESAVDCGLTYDVNYNPDAGDFSRECDYSVCDYTCDGLENYEREPDLSTYQLYYSQPTVEKLEQKLRTIFRVNFSVSEDGIAGEDFPDFTEYELVNSLRNLINQNMALRNKYGFSSYLKENDGQYFLVNSLTAIPEKFSEYYASKPYIRDPVKFIDFMDELEVKYMPNVLKALADNADDETKFRELMNRVPEQIQEILIEASILARKKGVKKNVKFRNKVLEFFDHYIQEVGGVWVSSRLYEELEVLRCLKGEVWDDCKEKIVDEWTKQKEKAKTSLENNPYGYYGIYDPDTGKFWIRDVSEESKVVSENRKKKTTGAECTQTAWSRDKLLKLVEVLKLSYPEDFLQDLDWDELFNKAALTTWAKKVASEDMSEDALRRLLYYASFKKEALCPVLREWFEKNDILFVGKKDEKK